MTSPWQQALGLAAQTPDDRNRYVDFLRALSIMAVIVGHWLVAAPHVEDGVIVGDHLLGIVPWAQWLTWGFQVMPIFFLVGGYSNGVSWASARSQESGYAEWMSSRVQRLINPVLPLYLLWVIFASFATAFGVSAPTVKLASQLALVPVWFLAVYLLVVALVPLTWRLWERLGIWSCCLFVGLAVLVDLLVFGAGLTWVSYANFAFVWLGMHQLGYAWQAGHTSQPKVLALGIGGLGALALAVYFGPYPVAMIGVPGEPVSNSMPPTIALFALGIAQAGFLLALEPLGRRLLAHTKAWTAVILINGMIMTVYLWHLTAFVLVIALAYAAGVGLDVAPGTAAWWTGRPLWLALYLVALLPFIAVFARFERLTLPNAARSSKLRLAAAAPLIVAGLALTAAGGIGSPGWTGVRLWVVALPFIGAALIDFGPFAAKPVRNQ